eukprot:g1181.t1
MGLAVNIGAGCLQLQAFCDCSVFRFWHRLRRRGTAPGSAPKRRSGGPSSEEQDDGRMGRVAVETTSTQDVQKLKLPVLFFSGEEVATLEVSLDWTGRRVKQALRPFLGKGHTVATVIHEGGVLLDSESLERIHLANDAHLYVTLRQCTFLVEGAGAEAVNGFYLRRRGYCSSDNQVEMARLALALVAILPHGLLCLDPFALTSKQKSELQIAATTAVLPSESTCPGMNEEPTDTEKDFATNPYWKYFTYDTFDSHSWASLKPILGLIKNEQLAPLGCDNMYCDSRLIVREYQRILTGPTENWHVIHDMRNMVPDYKTASVGLVLVSIRAILSDELFGSSSMNAYSQICGILIGSLLPGDGTSVIQYFCNPGSEWYNAMLTAKLRIAKDIAKSLATLVTILESLIEGMYWQESLVGPSDYLQPFLKKNVVNVTGCWRQTHGNWHRVAAQMMKELMQFITTDVYTTTLTSLSQEQKQQAWGSLNLVVAEFLVFVNALKIMSAADTVNLCRVFKLAKEVGMSGEPLNYQIMPMLDAAGVNSMLTKTLQAQDPVTNIDLGVNLRVATKPCNYDLKEVFVDEVTGLSAFTLEDLDVSGQYVDSSSFEDTAVKFRLAVRTCPLSLVVKASANFVQDGGSNKFTNVACRRVQWRVNAEVHLTFQISELIAFAQAGFQKIFAGASDALSGGVESFLLDIQHLELARFEITNFPGEANIKNLVNKALEGTLREKLSELVQGKVELAMNEAIQGAMAQAGSKIPFGSERRLGTCPANAGSARGTAYWYFSREGDLSRSDGDFYRVKSDAPKPPLEDWTCEACPLGRRTQVPSLTFCGEEDEESFAQVGEQFSDLPMAFGPQRFAGAGKGRGDRGPFSTAGGVSGLPSAKPSEPSICAESGRPGDSSCESGVIEGHRCFQAGAQSK